MDFSWISLSTRASSSSVSGSGVHKTRYRVNATLMPSCEEYTGEIIYESTVDSRAYVLLDLHESQLLSSVFLLIPFLRFSQVLQRVSRTELCVQVEQHALD